MTVLENFVANLKSNILICDVVKNYIRLNISNGEGVGLCPFHNEKTPSFRVSNNKGFYHCFGCGEHGDVFNFVMKITNNSFMDVVRELSNKAGMAMPEFNKSSHSSKIMQDENSKLLAIMLKFTHAFTDNIFANQTHSKNALHYLHKRGISDAIIKKHQLGFVGNLTYLQNLCSKNDISNQHMHDCGLFKNNKPYFVNRIIFPIKNAKGEVVSFAGRTIADDIVPKYLNGPETKIFKKSNILFNLHNAKTNLQNNSLIVTEGYLDTIVLDSYNISNVVATMGTTLSDFNIMQLWKYSDEPVICFDADNAGIKAMERVALNVLPLLLPGKSIRFAFINSGDPDSYIRDNGADSFNKLIKQSILLCDFLWSVVTKNWQFTNPEQQSKLEKQIFSILDSIKNKSVRYYYNKYFKDKLWHFTNKNNRNKNVSDKFLVNTNKLYNFNNTKKDIHNMGKNILLLCLIMHPYLFDSVSERLSRLVFDSQNIDNLKNYILSFISSNPEVNYSDLRNALIEHDIHSITFNHLLNSGIMMHINNVDEVSALNSWNDIYNTIIYNNNLAEDLNICMSELAKMPKYENFRTFIKLKKYEEIALNEEHNNVGDAKL